MRAGAGDVHNAVDQAEIPRRAEVFDGFRFYQRRNGVVVEVAHLQTVVRGVGHDETIVGDPAGRLRTVEQGTLKAAVHVARVQATDRAGQFLVQVHDHDSIVTHVGDRQPRRIRRDGQFGRIVERERILHFAFRYEVGVLDLQVRVEELQRRFAVEVQPVDHVVLADQYEDQLVVRSENEHGRPTGHAHLRPDRHLRIADHLVRDVVSLHGILNVLQDLLVGELRRVHADHLELIDVLVIGLDLLQGRQNVQTVDAAVGEEVEN